MSKNLVIVESPAKAKTIERFLGKDTLQFNARRPQKSMFKQEWGKNGCS